MISKLQRHEGGFALVIDRALADVLRISTDTPLEITTDGRTLAITPMVDTRRRRKFQIALGRTNRKHGAALEQLAD